MCYILDTLITLEIKEEMIDKTGKYLPTVLVVRNKKQPASNDNDKKKVINSYCLKQIFQVVFDIRVLVGNFSLEAPPIYCFAWSATIEGQQPLI